MRYLRVKPLAPPHAYSQDKNPQFPLHSRVVADSASLAGISFSHRPHDVETIPIFGFQ